MHKRTDLEGPLVLTEETLPTAASLAIRRTQEVAEHELLEAKWRFNKTIVPDVTLLTLQPGDILVSEENSVMLVLESDSMTDEVTMLTRDFFGSVTLVCANLYDLKSKGQYELIREQDYETPEELMRYRFERQQTLIDALKDGEDISQYVNEHVCANVHQLCNVRFENGHSVQDKYSVQLEVDPSSGRIDAVDNKYQKVSLGERAAVRLDGFSAPSPSKDFIYNLGYSIQYRDKVADQPHQNFELSVMLANCLGNAIAFLDTERLAEGQEPRIRLLGPYDGTKSLQEGFADGHIAQWEDVSVQTGNHTISIQVAEGQVDDFHYHGPTLHFRLRLRDSFFQTQWIMENLGGDTSYRHLKAEPTFYRELAITPKEATKNLEELVWNLFTTLNPELANQVDRHELQNMVVTTNFFYGSNKFEFSILGTKGTIDSFVKLRDALFSGSFLTKEQIVRLDHMMKQF